MHYTFILNPKAANQFAGRNLDTIKRAIETANLNATLLHTEVPHHATQLAKEAATNSDVVVAIGGDGTIHEVASGVIQSGCHSILGVIPFGTGNDFAKMLGLSPYKIDEAIHALKAVNLIHADYGKAIFDEYNITKEAFFINQLGMGFDAASAYRAQTLKYLPGKTLPYLAAVLATLRRYQCPKVQIWIDDVVTFEERYWFMTAGNGSCSGGGFYITPNAQITDGVLDVCVVRASSKMRVLQILPSAFSGKHIHAPEVNIWQGKKIVLHSLEKPLPIHADGELLSAAASKLEVHIQSGQLRVISAKK